MKLGLTLHQTKTSKYSGEMSRLSSTSWANCLELLDVNEEENPLKHGFQLGDIYVGDRCYLKTEFVGKKKHLKFESFNYTDKNDIPIIVHGPEQVHGYHENSFMCGAVASVLGCNWVWYKNGVLLDEGIDLCIIKVKESGD